MPATATIQRPTFTDVDVINALRFNASTVLTVTVPDATSSTEGVVRLTGDLAGTATAPVLAANGVTAGTYGDSGDNIPSITVDAKGRVSNIANRAMPNTAVTAGSYAGSALNVPALTVDAKGRLTAVADRDLTALVRTAVFEALWPVGEVLMTRRSGNPSSWLGFGTWIPYAPGRTLVGINPADSDFDAIDKEGGSKTATAPLPAHTHSISGQTVNTDSVGNHFHSINPPPTDTNATGDHAHTVPAQTATTTSNGAHTHTVTAHGIGSGSSGDQLAWEATATATTNTYSTSSSGDHAHSVTMLAQSTISAGTHAHTLDIEPFNSSTTGAHAHSVVIPGATTGSTGTDGSHTNVQPYTVFAFWLRTA